MTTVTVTETIKAGGAVVEGVRVDIRLYASTTDPDAVGYVPADNYTWGDVVRTATSNLGVWSATLEPNANFSLADTAYRIDYHFPGGGHTWTYIQVETSPSSQRVEDIQAVIPAPMPAWNLDDLADVFLPSPVDGVFPRWSDAISNYISSGTVRAGDSKLRLLSPGDPNFEADLAAVDEGVLEAQDAAGTRGTIRVTTAVDDQDAVPKAQQDAALALKANLASPTFTGTVTAPVLVISGSTGAASSLSWVGANAAGAPASGTHAVGDIALSRDGRIFVCTVLGTPGTWVDVAKTYADAADATAIATAEAYSIQRANHTGTQLAATISDFASAVGLLAQPLDTDLSAIAALVSAANKIAYATGAGTWSLTDFSAFARTFLDDADAATVRATLGVLSLGIQAANAVAITGGNISGTVVDLAAINDQVGTTYTFVLGDASKKVRFTNAAAITVTVPTNASVAFPIGTTIAVCQGGAGQVNIPSGVGGVTVNATPGNFLRTQASGAWLTKVGTNTWDLEGDLSS